MGLEKAKTRIKDLLVGEASLVDKPANKRRFLLIKREGKKMDKGILEAILNGKLDDQSKVDAVLKAAKVSEKAGAAIQGALKLLLAHKDEMPDDVIKVLADLGGFEAEKADPPKVDPPKGEAPKDEVEKSVVASGAVIKADGSLDLTAVDGLLAPVIKSLWDSRATVQAENKKALEAIAKMDDDNRLRLWVEKCAGFAAVAKPDELAPIMKAAEDGKVDEAGIAELCRILKSATEVAKASTLFKEIGANEGIPGGGAWGAIQKAAGELQEKDDKLSSAAATAAVIEKNPKLYADYEAERANGGKR